MSTEQNTDEKKSEKHPLVLRPRTSAIVDQFIADEAQLRQIVAACGSPVHVLFPQALEDNILAFEKVLAAHQLTGKIFFAHKANQSDSLLRQMAASNVRVDVASADELRHALACGFDGSRIEATGPKNPEFLFLCLMHSVTMNVDSEEELDSLLALKRSLAKPGKSKLCIRLCDFSAAHANIVNKESRFGIRVSEAPQVLSKIAEHQADLELLGFGFHLDSTSIADRLIAIENCLSLFEKSIEIGLEPSVLNIGGGFRTNYLASEDDWNRYTAALKEAVVGSGEELTWRHEFFGLSAQGSVLRGELNSYQYFEPTPGAAFLDELLNGVLEGLGEQKLSTFLRDNMIELWLEPGRALLDQAGLTLARVNGVKASSAGNTMVGLEMRRPDIAFLDKEVFVDPLVCPQANDDKATFVPVFIAGDLCLESDLIFRRKVFLARVPRSGDVLIFVNTAAYMMDFSSTRSAMRPHPQRVAVIVNGDGFTWTLDERYLPACKS